jgi:DNA-directed RNA polymerase specialized sigma24 family protein
MTDEEIFSGTAKGDENALRELFQSTREHVERVCAFFLGDDDRFPQAVVGTYRRALDVLAPEAPAPEIPLRSWLSILATQECFVAMEELRREYDQQTKMLEDISGNISTLVEISSDPKERVNFMIRGDIDDIPEQHRQVLAMSELEGLHFLELAKRMGCSWAKAMGRLIQARQALAKRVKESFGL